MKHRGKALRVNRSIGSGEIRPVVFPRVHAALPNQSHNHSASLTAEWAWTLALLHCVRCSIRAPLPDDGIQGLFEVPCIPLPSIFSCCSVGVLAHPPAPLDVLRKSLQPFGGRPGVSRILQNQPILTVAHDFTHPSVLRSYHRQAA